MYGVHTSIHYHCKSIDFMERKEHLTLALDLLDGNILRSYDDLEELFREGDIDHTTFVSVGNMLEKMS